MFHETRMLPMFGLSLLLSQLYIYWFYLCLSQELENILTVSQPQREIHFTIHLLNHLASG